ncbi:alpha carbonic anhydrase 1, chloroplastic [Magnolia sinica]|uniref:alpha carbonic anhydrase 1, chloroplastic n=1 Tax=Magnolia sinica TaxID=86752 RepID=UPI00265A3D6B|nr:alpha carbonic anhydrase 1, chloroplastic [Magnolia sinica]
MAARIAVFAVGFTSFLVAFAHAHQYNVKFGYTGSIGPTQWGNLSPDYQVCSNGKLQSPIDIVKKDVVSDNQLGPLVKDYGPANATLVDNGFNIAIQLESDAGGITIQGKSYRLKQLHWHSPSEHTIDGVRYPVELHLVHKSDDGNLAVTAMLYKFGDRDSFLTQLKDHIDQLAKEACGGDEDALVPLGILEAKEMEKTTQKYYRYIGSLTIPPCTENVIWSIPAKVRELTMEQVAALKAPLDASCKNNARPTQPLNGRQVQLHHE